MQRVTTELSELRQKADQCVRLVRGIGDHQTIALLKVLAAELEAQIRKLEAETGTKRPA